MSSYTLEMNKNTAAVFISFLYIILKRNEYANNDQDNVPSFFSLFHYFFLILIIFQISCCMMEKLILKSCGRKLLLFLLILVFILFFCILCFSIYIIFEFRKFWQTLVNISLVCV